MRIRLSRRVHHQHVASLETLDSMDGSDAIRSVTGTLLPEFLGEPDENSFGASDIAEPIRVLIPDHFADELRAAFDEPGQRVVDVAYGEHHAQVTESVHWSATVIGDHWRREEPGYLDSAVTVGRTHHGDLHPHVA